MSGLADDILRGATAIAQFLGTDRRAVYRAIERRSLPIWRDGRVICARRSTLTTWIADQERQSVGGAG